MKAMQALRHISRITNMSFYSISLGIGKSRQYVSNVATRDTTPSASNYAKMLEVCGYALCAVPADKIPSYAIIIDDNDENDAPVPFSGTRRIFSSIFDWEMSDKTLNDGEVLYRIRTGNSMDSLYFTVSAGTPLIEVQEHAKAEMMRHFGKKGPLMIKSIDKIPVESL